ncbi:MAG TPA: hypothetical protein VI636_07135 [Candidatus Angelobacter sp.]
MVFGLSLETYTLIHVVISLVAIVAGFIVLFGLLAGKRLDGWTALFLVTTVLTCAGGYAFPFHKLLPSHIIGAICLVVLLIAMLARYTFRLAGAWRWLYVMSATLALYLNVFVLVFQGFLKVPALKAAAPTQSEPPFLVAQLTVLVLFIVLTILAVRKFHEPVRAAGSRR